MGNVDSVLGQLEVERDKSEVFEDWTMAPGELGTTPVTVFSAAHPPTSRKRPYIERALQASRVYRHPGLLKYLDGGIIGGEVVIVTERATPLLHYDIDKFSPLHISAGLLSIIETLIFLHDRAGVSHNNVNSSCIFITSEGAWKLWGLEYSCSFGELTRDHIEHINSYCNDKSIPPDDKVRISPSYQHARDSYAFAKLVKDILTPDIVSEIAGAEDFLSVISKAGLNRDWSKRPQLATLAEHSIFSHDFLKIHENLANVLLLSDHKREEFLQNVGEQLRQYPEELVSSTLARSLMSRPVLLHPAAATHLMPLVLIPKTDDGGGGDRGDDGGGLFSKKVFEKAIVPQIIRLFNIHDATIRSILLLYLPHYVSLIPKDDLARDVLPELLLGIRDLSDSLVISTLHALAHLVPILGANTVIGENRKNLFTTAKPKAAANLPASKIFTSHPANVMEPKRVPIPKDSHVESLTTSCLDSLKDSEPPLPPPRSISLVKETINEDNVLEVTSLDNVSFDGLLGAQIPERSSPDGGEDSGSVTNLPGISGIAVSDSETWSDWEEMQDTQSEDFSKVLLSLNQDHANDFDTTSNNTKRVDISENENILSDYSKKSDLKMSVPKNDYGKVGVKLNTGMKLKTKNVNEKSSSGKINNNLNLGEEYDVLAIKINKKRDEELDLFADIVPKFDTKKYDLETMLIEAKSKSQVTPKERSPSLSETLAGLDIDGEDIGDAWGEDSWGSDQLELNVESPRTNSLILNSSHVSDESQCNSIVFAKTGNDSENIPKESFYSENIPKESFYSENIPKESFYSENITEESLYSEESLFNDSPVKSSVSLSVTEDHKDEWENWGDDF